MAEVRQVVVTGDGPVLLTGPVEVVLPDGRRVRSDRPVTALCVCRRSRRAPFCDTSHRRKVRAGDPTGAGDGPADDTRTDDTRTDDTRTDDTRTDDTRTDDTGNDEESRAQPHPTATG
jgi:CDGSH-type Zn-finger protein